MTASCCCSHCSCLVAAAGAAAGGSGRCCAGALIPFSSGSGRRHPGCCPLLLPLVCASLCTVAVSLCGFPSMLLWCCVVCVGEREEREEREPNSTSTTKHSKQEEAEECTEKGKRKARCPKMESNQKTRHFCCFVQRERSLFSLSLSLSLHGFYDLGTSLGPFRDHFGAL